MAEGTASSTGQPAGISSSGEAGSVNSPLQSAQESGTQKAESTEKTQDKPGKKETTDVTGEESHKETEKTEVKKHRYADRLIKAFPDRKFEKDEDYDTALDEHLDELEQYKNRAVKINNKLMAGFDAEPAVGDAIRDWLNGSTFRASIARHFSPEDFTAQEGDDDYEAWSQNKAKREEDLAKRKQLMDEKENNLKISQETMINFAKENEMDEEAAEKFYSKIDEMVSAIISGKISKETLTAMRRAFNYEQEVSKEKEKAAAAERNKNIVAHKEAPEKKGDGLPKLTKTSNEPQQAKSTPTWIDGVLERVNSKKVI
ncbi:MAG: hypothetical protein ACOXZV_00720 [Bacteroidales bacterium]|jgi:hypothetical protein